MNQIGDNSVTELKVYRNLIYAWLHVAWCVLWLCGVVFMFMWDDPASHQVGSNPVLYLFVPVGIIALVVTVLQACDKRPVVVADTRGITYNGILGTRFRSWDGIDDIVTRSWPWQWPSDRLVPSPTELPETEFKRAIRRAGIWPRFVTIQAWGMSILPNELDQELRLRLKNRQQIESGETLMAMVERGES